MEHINELAKGVRLQTTLLEERSVGLLSEAAIAADVIDLFKMLFRAHVTISAVFVAVNFADYLLHQRVFQNDVSEALVVHCLKDCILIWSFQAEYIKQVKPEVFQLVGGQVDELEVLGDADDHLVEGQRALRVLFYILWVVRVRLFCCFTTAATRGGSLTWGRWRPIRLRSHVPTKQLILVDGLEDELLLDFGDDGEHLVNGEVEQTLRIDNSLQTPLGQDFDHAPQRLHKITPCVFAIVKLQQ